MDSKIYDHLAHYRLGRRGSWRRGLNSKLISLQYKAPLWDKVLGYPKNLIIDTINKCNLRCPLCPSGQVAIPRKTGVMELGLYQQIIKELGPYLYTLILTNWGEPLLQPRLIEMIRFARKFPVYIGISSNFHHLARHGAEQLILSGLDEIAVSIDGASQQIYERYRRGGNLELVLANLRELLAVRKRLGSTTPKVRWQYLVTRDSEQELEAVKTLAAEIGVDELVLVPIYLGIQEMFTNDPQTRYQRYRDWLPSLPEFTLYDPQTGTLKDQRTKCHMLWDTFVVNWDGTVSPCCAVIDPVHDFGDLRRQKFRQIWNGPAYTQARKMFRTGLPSELPLVCRSCLEHGVVIF